MWPIFRGWRRKAGCTTLVLACVFAAVWARSSLAYDEVSVTIRGRQTCVISVGSRFYWCSWTRTNVRQHKWATWTVQSAWTDGSRWASPYRHSIEDRVSLVESWLPVALDYPEAIGGRFSYSIFVIPITLLSAFLLLWKPQQVK